MYSAGGGEAPPAQCPTPYNLLFPFHLHSHTKAAPAIMTHDIATAGSITTHMKCASTNEVNADALGGLFGTAAALPSTVMVVTMSTEVAKLCRRKTGRLGVSHPATTLVTTFENSSDVTITEP